ncbi:MAG: hypothetical protein BGN83_21830 [Rhizobium sp. 63-7]|nr:MAG: hypothetical protein BGN83_21830 [Rhizobium sp. 63-7]
MNKWMARIATVGLSMAVVFSSMVPSSAMPLPQVSRAESPVVNVAEQGARVYPNEWRHNRNWRGDRRGWRGDRGWRHGRNWDRRGDRRHGWYNGHRGYRDYRRGYRRHGGYWFPLAAFGAGAIIGGAMNQPRVYRNVGSDHVSWCQNRWRSYRAYDNTYQPYNGPRRVCVSPYS